MSQCGVVEFTTFSKTKLITGNTERVSNLTIQPDEDTYGGTLVFVTRKKNVTFLHAINDICGNVTKCIACIHIQNKLY
jgi:hypothetical protein